MPRMNITEAEQREYESLCAAIGNRVRDARLLKEWTQEDLGRHLGKGTSWISAIEIGRHGTNIMMLLQFARVLEQPLAFFLPGGMGRTVDVSGIEPPKNLPDWQALYPNDAKRAQSHAQLDSVFRETEVEVGQRQRARKMATV